MKKLFLSLIFCITVGTAHAGVFDSLVQTDSFLATYMSPATTLSTAAVVIDLSDTTTYPHKKSSAIAISSIRMDIDHLATSTGTVKLGVVTEVNASSGVVKYFWVQQFSKNEVAAPGPTFVNLESGWLRALVSSSATPYMITNVADNISAVFQTDVPLPSTTGTAVAPAVGDIILRIDSDGTNTITATVSLFYHAER